MECQCEKDNPEDAGWWMNTNSVQMGAFTVVGYILYRFSQTLPALIRWPIRLFCSVTGLSALWSWVSRLVGTLRVIKSLCKWLAGIWRFFAGSPRNEAMKSETNKPGLTLILLGPAGGGRTSLADTLLGSSEKKEPIMESTKRRTVVDGREVIVIDTPDLLGLSLGNNKRAREALRSLQLSSPGPHAFLLVIRASGSSVDQDAAQAIQATLELFGDSVAGHIIPVFTHADRLGRRRSLDQLLDSGGLRRALSVCEQRPELLDNRPDCPEAQSVTCRQLAGRVMEMKTLKGHFVHEMQRREERMKEELLADMSSALAAKLGH
ncbi:immune-associated nucleotide-binding protein 5-like isoform X2 [Plectropomus leopardus]|uniref:immune-associated nucleotide-binding protein 5-like isoform X2 n=1 Tax=Plectropomus leopardus TaxID=160734 RepID=UPI001C4D5CCD|nr:immune-associated nucleotide-binding protein 5-like isoform X2 [Plectropomus leopardus]